MPKRLSDHDQSPTPKRTRAATSNTARRSSDDKTTELLSPQPHRRRTLSAVSPAQLSDANLDIPDSRPAAAIRRRMNPDSLAYRLGPELIKELEALLKPGTTEMPSFSVRQEIQQRYNIDRRHIYDWFHNKGLRVSGSDKRSEMSSAKMKEPRRVPDTRIQRKLKTSESSLPPPPPTRPVSTGSSTPALTTSVRPAPSPVSSNLLSYEAACHLQRLSAYPVHPFAEYYDTPFYSHPQLLAYPQLHAVPHAPYLFTTFPEYHGLPVSSTETHAKHLADRTSDWISEQQKIPYTPNPAGRLEDLDSDKTQQDKLDAMFPLDNEQTLPRPQREAFYQSLSDVLPPACGIEESVGTYKAFMTQQVQGYYDRLVSGNATGYEHASSFPYGHDFGIVPNVSSVAPTPVSYSVLSHNTRTAFAMPYSQVQTQGAPIPSSSEFSSWLRYIGHSQASSVAPSPSQTPDLSETGTSTSSIPWPPEMSQEHCCENSRVPSLEISEILESPVLRSRHTTCNVYGDIISLKTPSKTPDDGIAFAGPSPTRKKMDSQVVSASARKPKI